MKRQETVNQKGKTFIEILRRLALIVGVVLVLFFFGQLFGRILFGDSA